MMTRTRFEESFAMRSSSRLANPVWNYLLGVFIFISSISFPFFKVILKIPSIQRILSDPYLNGTDYSQLIQMVHGVKIVRIAAPILVGILLLIIFYLNRKNIVFAIRQFGLVVLLSGLAALALESVLFILVFSFLGNRTYTVFLGLSGNNAQFLEMITEQMGNVFLFYWGTISFGLITLGLILTLIARVFKR